MGCIPSKIFTKSLTFNKADLNQSSKGNRVASGISMLDEFLITTATSKIQISSFASPPKSSLEEPKIKETINTWELMAGLEEQVDQNLILPPAQELAGSQILEVDKIKRSKSCEWSAFSKFEGLDDDKFNFGSKNVGRSRSFHTVEEYDAMLEKILNDDDVQETAQSFLMDEYPAEEGTVGLNCDTGLKRKAVAKGLELLQIPSSVQFRAIGSLREWLHGGGRVDSPGEYVTPKFGNYNRPRAEFGKEAIINPELVAAFEELMQQLEVEEESVLKEIEGNMDEIADEEIAAEEERLQNLQD